MKIGIGIVVLILILLDIGIYIQLRKYCKAHENELVEEHTKYIYSKMVWIVVISILVGILGILLQLL